MNKTARSIILAFVALAGLLWVSQLTISTAVDNVVAGEAERNAIRWAEHFVENTSELSQLLDTGKPNQNQITQIEIAATIGDVFRFKLFDSQGNLILISDEVAQSLETGASDDHSGTAAAVIATGVANVSLHDGTQKENRPDLYVEAYVPVINPNGDVLAVVEVYLDQTLAAAALKDSFNAVAATIALVLILSFGVPYLAFMFKTRQETSMRNRADYLAKFDLTTGLMNRASLIRSLEKKLEQEDLDMCRTGVGFIDVDNFKLINDAFGHKAGDAYLKHISAAILAEVGPEGLVGRFGGDEIVFVTGHISRQEMEKLVEKIRIQASAPIRVDGASLKGSLSIGVHYDEAYNGALRFADRVQKADVALYQSKLDGKDRTTFYTKALELSIENRRHIEASITNAIEEDRMQVHFQPLLHRENECIAGFEALLRLKDRDGKNIPPLEFIPIAEEMGVIKTIGAWVIEQAAFAASAWPDGLFVSVNLSSRQFDDGKLDSDIKAILERTGVDPSRLELEITESLLMVNTESVAKQLAAIGSMGISLAMDDFGTGYSSLGYLWQFGFNKIKIDKSFVSGLSSDPQKVKEILDTIVMLGHRLDMTVTAEGIETADQAAALGALGCDHFQGYHYGRPMPITDVPAYMLKNFEHGEARKLAHAAESTPKKAKTG